jgi:hypothetical protein
VDPQGDDPVSDVARKLIALRTIAVSGRSALARAQDDATREAVLDRIDALLADLEGVVIRDGGNEQVLAAIEAERMRR